MAEQFVLITFFDKVNISRNIFFILKYISSTSSSRILFQTN